jgi:hypothetical protein
VSAAVRAQNKVTRARLTTAVSSTNKDRPNSAPSNERHHTYPSLRRICGYSTPSRGSRVSASTGAGRTGAGRGGFGGRRWPAGRPGEVRRLARFDGVDRFDFATGSGVQGRPGGGDPGDRRIPAQQLQRLEQRW